MTLTDLTTDPVVVSLCAALDAGDDSALLPLADLLEELGDRRAEGLRVMARGYNGVPITPIGYGIIGTGRSEYSWAARAQEDAPWPGHTGIPTPTFDRMHAMRHEEATTTHRARKLYPSRHAAFLALAEALID